MLRIRTLTQADAAQFGALRLEGLRESPQAFGSSFEVESRYAPSVYEGWLAPRERSGKVGAFDGPQLVGIAGLIPDGDDVTVVGMYVAPAARRQGIARALMRALLAQAREMPGVVQVRLGVKEGNAQALALYASLGFAVTGERDGEIAMARLP